MDATLQASLIALGYSRNFVKAILAAIPEDKYCHQPCPGGNHTLWILGHLPSVDAGLLAMCGGPADPLFEKM